MRIGLNCIITGRVQGVMFRDFVQRKATALGIVGTVENKQDGTVEVLASGEKENLEKLLELFKKGPLLTRIRFNVENVKVEWRETTENFSDFKIIY